MLLTMATGTGKTVVAFQICWKLWRPVGIAQRQHRAPKILFLADRNILVDDPKDRTFTPFGDARHKIESGEVVKSREMYFAIYQAIAEDERRAGLFTGLPAGLLRPHHRRRVPSRQRARRSSLARDSRVLRARVPTRHDGDAAARGQPRHLPLFRQPDLRIQPAPGDRRWLSRALPRASRRHHWDAAGWRPSKGELDRYGREIPDDEYQTKEFERVVALRARTEAIAQHLTDFLKKTDRFAKTIVFCVDQEHADEMRRAPGQSQR